MIKCFYINKYHLLSIPDDCYTIGYGEDPFRSREDDENLLDYKLS